MMSVAGHLMDQGVHGEQKRKTGRGRETVQENAPSLALGAGNESDHAGLLRYVYTYVYLVPVHV